jgi:DNA-binding transcriptional ArsR family regulator
MAVNANVAAVGHMLAAPARAAMLDVLFDGGEWPVSGLAQAARIAPSTASEHLELLRRGGLVTVAKDRRYRRYRLAGPQVAEALEALGALAPPLAARGLTESSRNEALHRGRTCYDHLAGRLGVGLTEALVARRLLRAASDGLAPTPAGTDAFARIAIDIESLRRARRPVTRSCLDWSERQPHLAGGLGAALLARLEAERGIERIKGSRAVLLRAPGRALLAAVGVELDGA